MEIRIKKCIEPEIETVGRFYDDVVSFLNAHVNYPRWIQHVYPCEETVREMTEKGAQYVCRNGDTIVGAFALNDEPQGNYQKGNWSEKLKDGEYMVIHALAIHPAFFRQGIGKEMIRFCVERAREEGYLAVRADIVPTNTPARKLFQNCGFSYMGDADLMLNLGDIPAFSLYEYPL